MIHSAGWELYDDYIEQGLFNRADTAEELIAHICREYSPEQLKEPAPYVETGKQHAGKAIETILASSGESQREIDRANKYGKATAANDRTIAEQFFKSGFYSFREGDFKKAVSFFENAKACCPEMPELHFALATAHAQSGNFQAAKRACEEELKIQPGHHGAGSFLERIEQAFPSPNQMAMNR